MNRNIINVLFDAGRGEVTRLSMEAETGKPIGNLPRAARRGYRFIGWYTSPQGGASPQSGVATGDGVSPQSGAATGDGRFTEDTVVTSTCDFTLYARYEKLTSGEKRAAGTRRRSMFRLQKRAVLFLLAAVLLLGGAAFYVLRYVVDTHPYEDPADGTVYYVRRVWDEEAGARVFRLTDKDSVPLPTVNYATAAKEYTFYETAAGTWVQVSDTGSAETYAVVDTDGEEQVGFGDRVLLFPAISQEDIYSIEVTNSHGSYKIVRDEDGIERFEGGEGVLLAPDAEMFASLCTACGYTLSAKRLEDPIRDADGSFASEYGLDGSTRYVITRAVYDKNGKCTASDESYTVYIGDALPSDGGYYVQLAGRDKVYLFSTAGRDSAFYHPMDETVLAPVEDLVSPLMTYPMDPNTYFDIKDFMLVEVKDGYFETENADDLLLKIQFSYVPTWERTGTLDSSVSYKPDADILAGFRVDTDKIGDVTKALCTGVPLRCVKLLPDDADFAAWGLDTYRHILRFGMWIDMSDYFVGSDGTLQDDFLPDDAKVTYRSTYTGTKNLTDSSNTSYRFDTLTDATVYSFTVKEVPADDPDGEEEEFTYRVTVTSQSLFYGGTWLTDPEALKAELGRDDYIYEKDGSYYRRYDASTGNYYYRLNGHVYYGKAAIRAKDYDTAGAKAERLLINTVILSDKTENGTYYAYNALCEQIVEVGEENLSYLEWDSVEWVDSSIFPIPLAYVTDIDITAGAYHAQFIMDNSRSDQSEGFDSAQIEITGSDSDGFGFNSLGQFVFYCTQTSGGETLNTVWTITEDDYSIMDADTGEMLRYSGYSDSVATNSFGVEVKTVKQILVCTDGSRVSVGADWVTVTKDGETTRYPRYAVKNFRQFYIALMYATLEGNADLNEADPARRDQILDAIERGDDSVCQLVLRIKGEDTAASTNDYYYDKNNKFSYVFRFYQYTKGKSYLTIEVLDEDGNPISSDSGKAEQFRFYVKASFVDKLVADVRRVLRGEAVTADSKS